MKIEKQARRFARWLGSAWTFRLMALVFAAEAGWQALTSPFPMTYDEAYHFGLIKFFGQHPNPLITSQSPDTYRLGAIVQNPSFLYHYLMSFPYRLISLFTHTPELQLISLRLINVALAVGGLLIMRRLLKSLKVSDALTNLLVLMVAFTPIFTVLSGQLNYDNLFIPAATACIYMALSFLRQLDGKVFNIGTFMALLSLCLFTSLIKFAFLPIFVAIAALVGWGIYSRRGSAGTLKASALKSWKRLGLHAKVLLIGACVVGGFMFLRIYGVNLVRYHNPAPQCDQVLNVQDCKHYYSWDLNYQIKAYSAAHHIHRVNVLRYDGYWFLVVTFEPFSVLTPFQGHIYAFTAYLIIVGLLGVGALLCTVMDFRHIWQNRELRTLLLICAFYIVCLWARNYHDYVQLSWPRAIHGRYLLPILICLYLLLATGVRDTLDKRMSQARALTAKAALALIIVASFLYYGGFHQYVHYVYPVYGRISQNDNFKVYDAYPAD